MDNNSLYDAIEKIVGLSNFLEVKAPDKVVTFLYDSDGKLTNKDGIGVRREDFICHNEKRLAENEKDFQEIFDVWFDKKRLNPQKQQDIIICAKFLISEVTRLQQQHEQGTNRDSVDLTLISLSNEFISFLESKQTKQERTVQHQKGFDLGLSDEQLASLHKALIDGKFLDSKTDKDHFINAFNGKVLTNFEKFKWKKSVYTAIFLKVNFDTDSKTLKAWQKAEKLFENGNATSLRNADKGIDLHKSYNDKLTSLMRSLQQITVN